MNWRIASAFFLIPILSALGLYGAILETKKINKLNAILPEQKQFPWLGWHAGKYFQFQEQYQRAFPADRLMRNSRYVKGGMVFVLLCLIALDIIR